MGETYYFEYEPSGLRLEAFRAETVTTAMVRVVRYRRDGAPARVRNRVVERPPVHRKGKASRSVRDHLSDRALQTFMVAAPRMCTSDNGQVSILAFL